MPEPKAWTVDEMAAFAARYGLTDLPPEALAHMAALATHTAATAGSVPRVASKSDEPASTFKVPLDD
jgi:hypothetical protein